MRIAIILIVASLLMAVAAIYWPSSPDQVFQVEDNELAVAAPEPGKPVATAVNATPAPIDAIDQMHDDSGTIREVHLDAGADYMETMKALGLDDLEERYGKWLLSRGYAFSDHTGAYLLDQPYNQYDDETLLAFARNNDMWAQQFLAERLEKTRPAEALDWYRKAAINGSVNAMNKVIALYSKIGLMRVDGAASGDEYKEQIYAIRDGVSSVDEMGYAWSVASQLAGGDPSQNRALAARMERNFDEDARNRACQMAQGIYDDMSGTRAERGLSDFNRSPPPFMLGSLEDLTAPPCAGLQTQPTLDFSACEEINVVTNGLSNRVMVCDSDAG